MLAGISGALIPIVIFLGIWLAISDASWFRWTHNALSDLGIQGLSAFFFNNGIIFGGILVLIFSIVLTQIIKNKIGAYVLSISSLALIGAGIFPKTVIFFVCITIALFFIGYSLKKEGNEQTLGVIAIILAVIACSSIFFQNFLNGIAIPEAIVCFPAFIWFMIFGLKITINHKSDNPILQN
jgi:hypothetical membrane protein